MIARKKIGIETPISETNRLAWSTDFPWRFAAMKPSGMPRKVAKIMALNASSIVAGKRSRISSVIGRRGGDARPEVARADRLQVPPILLVDRVVEPVLVANLRHRLCRGPLTEQRLGRRPGECPIQRKTSSESPMRIGTSRSSRRTAKRSTVPLPRRPPAHRHSVPSPYPMKRVHGRATTPASRGSACSLRPRSSGSRARASCAPSYGTPGRKFMIMRFARWYMAFRFACVRLPVSALFSRLKIAGLSKPHWPSWFRSHVHVVRRVAEVPVQPNRMRPAFPACTPAR